MSWVYTREASTQFTLKSIARVIWTGGGRGPKSVYIIISCSSGSNTQLTKSQKPVTFRTRTYFCIFTARRYASAVLAVIVCLSVCLSVCPSDTSPSCTKVAKPRIRLTMPYDSQETLVFWCQKSWRNSNDITLNGGAKERWGRFLAALCGQYLDISQKRCKTGTQLLWKANRNSCALYQMVLFSMTLGDP